MNNILITVKLNTKNDDNNNVTDGRNVKECYLNLHQETVQLGRCPDIC